MFLAKFGVNHYSEALLTFGWSHPEQDWVWSEGKLSVVSLPGYIAAKCRISLVFETAPSLGADAVMRISINGLDYGERRFGAGHHNLVLEHEERQPNTVDGLVISFFHLSCRAPAEVEGGDKRIINIGLRALSVETLALRKIDKIPTFSSGSPAGAYFVRRELDSYRDDAPAKWRVRDEVASGSAQRAAEFLLYGLGGNRHDRQFVVAALQDAPPATELKLNLLHSEGLPRPFVEALCPEFAPVVLSPAGFSGVERRIVAEARDNPLYDPKPLVEGDFHIASFADLKTLQEEAIFTHKDADLIASPRQFMIFDRQRLEFFHGCNPSGLTLMSTDLGLFETSAPVALVRDQFDAGNVAHFLFDTCLRILNFCEAFPALASQTLFVAGGIPGEFHKLAGAALASLCGFPPENIVFPRSPVRIRSAQGVFWFSDQVYDRHPCQRFRPEALAKLQTLAKAMQAGAPSTAARARKLYVSRSDATLRRLVNEDELTSVLSELGFQKIVMSEHSWADQIDLLAGAETIVAPHGMGLTMLAFNLRSPRLVEIFNPTTGSGAYALLAKAYGMEYHAFAGKEVDPNTLDFAISREDIARIAALVSG